MYNHNLLTGFPQIKQNQAKLKFGQNHQAKSFLIKQNQATFIYQATNLLPRYLNFIDKLKLKQVQSLRLCKRRPRCNNSAAGKNFTAFVKKWPDFSIFKKLPVLKTFCLILPDDFGQISVLPDLPGLGEPC